MRNLVTFLPLASRLNATNVGSSTSLQMDQDGKALLTNGDTQRALALQDDELRSLLSFLEANDRGNASEGNAGDKNASTAQGPGNHPSTTLTTKGALTANQSRLQSKAPVTSLQHGRTGTALLKPIPLMTTPPPIKVKKRRRPTGEVQELRKKRGSGWRTGVVPLDITYVEIESLVDCLMRQEKSNGVENVPPPSPMRARNASGRRVVHSSASYFDTVNRRIQLLRPLPAVMASLRSAARLLPNTLSDKTVHVRGPGPDAVPSSATRVLEVLAGVEQLWGRDSSSTEASKTSAAKQLNEGFTEEELEEVVKFFDISGQGYMSLKEVIPLLRGVCGDHIGRPQPPIHALLTLVAIGSYLDEHGITPAEFVQEAASLPRFDTDSLAAMEGEYFTDDHTSNTESTQATKNRYADDKPATREQMGVMLHRVMPHPSEEQCDAVIEQIEEDGLVCGEHLAGAVQRAREELARRRHHGQQQSPINDKYRSRETESEKYFAPNAGVGMQHGIPPRCEHETAGVRVTVRNHDRTKGASHTQSGGFNHTDAAILLYKFTRDAGRQRSITPRSALASWNALKRRNQDMSAYRAGLSAAKSFCRLLCRRSVKPLVWFHTLKADIAGDSTEERRVSMSSVVAGIQFFLGMRDPAESEADKWTKFDSDCSSSSQSFGRGMRMHSGMVRNRVGDKWNMERFAALIKHLDPCGRGGITAADLEDALRDCEGEQNPYCDSSSLKSARRFEKAVRALGCKDICRLLCELVSGGRGGDGLDEYMGQLAESARPVSREPTAVSKDRRVRAITKPTQVCHGRSCDMSHF